MHKIFVVSGGTGRTAKHIIKAALTQFPEQKPEIIVFPDIRFSTKIKSIIKDAKNYNALVVYTLVEKKLRKTIVRECEKLNVQHIDFMGDMIDKMSNLFSEEPLQSPGLFNKLNSEYFKRIDAVQFTFKHDDGARVEDLEKADIVLLGVSRTFKTPLSVYLSYKGYFVINIPIVEGIQPPKELNRLDPSKVFCLNTNAYKLAELRTTRNEKLGEYVKDYSDVDKVKKELQYAMRYYILHSEWKIINVTGKPIEEIASEILDIYLKKMCDYIENKNNN